MKITMIYPVSHSPDDLGLLTIFSFSVLLVDCPINSTVVENRPGVESHHTLELSRISAPSVLLEQIPTHHNNSDEAAPERAGLHICVCGKECTR